MTDNPRIRRRYKKANWRNTNKAQADGSIPIGFKCAGGDLVLLLLPIRDAADLAWSINHYLADYWHGCNLSNVKFPRSAGMSNSPGPKPAEGQ